jgi:glycosyltransferase involved in cell wall biosynthesis
MFRLFPEEIGISLLVTKMVVCSILTTTYNTGRTIRESLGSVLSQIDDSFEVIVVDNFSNDGSLTYLKGLSESGKIRLLVTNCNRGQGRQIALRHAKGKYVIAKVDCDLVYKPIFKKLVRYYIKKEREIGDFVLYANVMVSSKEFLTEIGGWRPLQWGENYELHKRLIDMGKLYFCKTRVIPDHIKPRNSFLGRLKTAYVDYRDSFRIGLRTRVIGKEVWTKYGLMRCLPRFLILSFAWFASSFYEKWRTFENVGWEEFYRDSVYSDYLGLFEINHPDKVLTPTRQ